jgi:hypothetical protein
MSHFDLLSLKIFHTLISECRSHVQKVIINEGTAVCITNCIALNYLFSKYRKSEQNIIK